MQTVSNNGQRAANNCAQLPHSADAQIVANADEKISFSHFNNKRDNEPKSVLMDWRQLCDRLKNRSFRASKDGSLFSGAVYPEQVWRREHQVPDPQDPKKKLSFRDPRNPTPEDWRAPIRSNDFVEAVSLAILDFDGGATLDQIKSDIQRLNNGAGAAAVIYSTFSHTPDVPKFRVFIWLLVPVAASEWPEFWARLSRHFGDKCDASAKDAARIHYTPSCPKSGEADAVYIELDGAPLDGATLPAIPKTVTAAPKMPTTATAIGGDAYARQTLQNECERLKATTSDRNKTLNDKAIKIGGYIGAGRLNRADAENALEAAMHANGYVEKDGLAAMHATMKSGLDAGMRTPNYQNLPTDRTRPTAATSSSQVKGDANNGHAEPQIKTGFPMTDTGNAERYIHQHGENFVYVNALSFMVSGDTHWQEDERGAIGSWEKKTVRTIYAEAAMADDEGDRKALAKWATKSESSSARKAMIENVIKDGPRATPADFDADKMLFNVANGTLDLKIGELMPHRRENLITKVSPIVFDPHAQCPLFLQTLGTIFNNDEEVIRFVQRAIGYSLTGLTREQCFFILHGKGANGKSLLLKIVAALLSDYWKHAPASVLMQKRSDAIPNDVAMLRGARVATAIETNEGRKFDEALAKAMTGDEPITARFFRKEFFTFDPEFKIFLATNHKPQIVGTDDGIWRRIRLLPFNVRFWDADKGESGPPHLRADKSLGERILNNEMPGILNWALQGCLDYQSDGLPSPDAVKGATEDYRQEMDPLQQFIGECAVQEPSLSILKSEFHKAFGRWAKDNDLPAISSRTFSLRMLDKGFKEVRGHGGIRKWAGISLVTPDEKDDISPSGDRLERRF